jgi:hypothetical protein
MLWKKQHCWKTWLFGIPLFPCWKTGLLPQKQDNPVKNGTSDHPVLWHWLSLWKPYNINCFGNVWYTVMYAETERGRQKLLLEGYIYTKHEVTRRHVVWRCCNRTKCHARIWILTMPPHQIIKRRPHSHPPDWEHYYLAVEQAQSLLKHWCHEENTSIDWENIVIIIKLCFL